MKWITKNFLSTNSISAFCCYVSLNNTLSYALAYLARKMIEKEYLAQNWVIIKDKSYKIQVCRPVFRKEYYA